MKAPLPDNEAQRLAILREYNVLDSMPEQAFDDLTLIAAQICQTPIALITLVDENRQWFKSKIGLSATETSRDAAFCAHAILNPDEVLEVPDAQLDSRFANNPLVTADPNIRFYVGAPLAGLDGVALGTLCAIDRVPRKLSAEQTAALQALSRTVVARLELRRIAQQQRKALDLSHSGKKKWALESKTVTAFAAAILSLLIVGAILIRSLLLLSQEVDWVQHTQKVIEQANHMLANVVEVQSGTRGYLIMGADSYLATYNLARLALPQDLQKLRKLTADSPAQQQRLDVIAPLVEKRLDISRNLVELRQTQGFNIAQAAMMLGQGQTVTDQIRQLHKEVVEEQNRLLTERNQETDSRVRFTLASIGSLGALSVIILGLAGIRIRREIITRSEAQARVEMLNADLEFRAAELAAARHRAEISDQLKSAILKHAGHAIISTTPDGIITSFNQTAERMLGYAAAEMVGLQTPEVFHDPAEVVARAQEFSAELGVAIAPGFEVFFAKARRDLPNEYEWTYNRKDGTRFPVLLTVTSLRDAAGEITGFLGIAIDISLRKQIEMQLQLAMDELRRRGEIILQQAMHDELTGLPNRRLYHDRLAMALSEARRHGLKVAVAFIDLDYFKEINDTLGHEAGDKFLVAIAQRIKAVPREEDTCARLGGDEFALILSNVPEKDQVGLVMQRILDSLNREIIIDGIHLHSSASIGVAIFPDDAENAPTLLKHADMAMYRSKEEGRNTCRFWDKTMVPTQHAEQTTEVPDQR